MVFSAHRFPFPCFELHFFDSLNGAQHGLAVPAENPKAKYKPNLALGIPPI